LLALFLFALCGETLILYEPCAACVALEPEGVRHHYANKSVALDIVRARPVADVSRDEPMVGAPDTYANVPADLASALKCRKRFADHASAWRARASAVEEVKAKLPSSPQSTRKRGVNFLLGRPRVLNSDSSFEWMFHDP
jgi:hypothetical protein